MQLAYGPLIRSQGLDADPGGLEALKIVLAFSKVLQALVLPWNLKGEGEGRSTLTHARVGLDQGFSREASAQERL